MAPVVHITSGQLEHFAVVTRSQFAARLAEYVRAVFPEHAPPGDEKAQHDGILAALAVCEKYGITTEPEAAQVVLIFLVLGMGSVERELWIQEAIAHDAAPSVKVQRLVEACRAQRRPIDDVLVIAANNSTDAMES